MKKQEKSKLTTLASGLLGLLMILAISLACVESGQTSRKDNLFDSTNKQAKKTGKPAAQTSATEITGKVVGVSDGDTITVLDDSKTQHKIRLQGIDAPESAQPFGAKAKQNLSSLVFGKTVKVLVYKKDRYNREVGTVYVGDTDINLEQVKAGFAWHYKKYADEQPESERDDYAKAETEAKATQAGLWSDASPIEPEEWRGGKRESKTAKIPPTTMTIIDETAPTTKTEEKGLTVYITRTGEKYHRAGCRYLSRSQIPISLSAAKARYDACSVCNP